MDSATPIRWGILATGGIASSFTEDLALLPDAEVVAVGSRSAETARAFADTHGIPRSYGTWQALADDPPGAPARQRAPLLAPPWSRAR